MKTLIYNDCEDFVDYLIYNVLNDEEIHSIAIVGKFEDIRECLQNLIIYGLDIYHIDALHNPSIIDEDKEYAIEIDETDGIYVTTYLDFDDDICFYYYDCNKPKCKNDNIKQIIVGSEALSNFAKEQAELIKKKYDWKIEEDTCNDEDECNETDINEENDVSLNIPENMKDFSITKYDNDSYISYSVYSSDGLTQDFIKDIVTQFKLL